MICVCGAINEFCTKHNRLFYRGHDIIDILILAIFKNNKQCLVLSRLNTEITFAYKFNMKRDVHCSTAILLFFSCRL